MTLPPPPSPSLPPDGVSEIPDARPVAGSPSPGTDTNGAAVETNRPTPPAETLGSGGASPGASSPVRRGGPLRMARAILGVPEGCALRFFVQDKFWKWIMRQNTRVPWPVHFTSQVVCPERVRLGRGVFPGDSPHCYIQAINGIEIGDGSNLAPGVGLISANHDALDNSRHLPGPPLRIGAHCWIGMNAVVLPGVTLGDFTVVGAGAVVTKSFPEGRCVVAGNPARKVRDLTPPALCAPSRSAPGKG